MSEPLHIEELRVSFDGREVLAGLDLRLDAGGYGVVLGPSGCGKSTLLRAIAGLVPATGRIRIGDRLVCADRQVVPPESRRLGLLFQGLALWPHMSGAAHLAYALKGARVPAAEHEVRVREVAEQLGIAGLLARRPQAMSGGERQRLALARALVTRPGLLLLDEPTSSVDPHLAQGVQELLLDVRERFGTTVLHVTHDQDEALAVADRLYVMQDGRVVQDGPPEEIYDRPRSLAVARFIGRGTLVQAALRGDGTADTPLGIVPVDGGDGEGGAWILVRPPHLAFAADGEGVPVSLVRARFAGGAWTVQVTAGDLRLQLDVPAPPPAGASLRVKVVRPARVVERRRVP